MAGAPPLAPLAHPHNEAGELRRVGVELEFSGLNARRTAEITAKLLGGDVERLHAHRFAVETGHGRFLCELDTRWADPDYVSGHAEDLPKELRNALRDGVETIAAPILERIFPVELVCPPLPHDRLELLRPLADALAAAGALGTRHSAFSGFGMHLNVEVAALRVDHVLSVLRAYLLLSFELRREADLALIRQVQSYIEPFPEAYKRHVLQPDHAPEMGALIDDHLRFNPTRNMELDLLPLFAFIDRERVFKALPGEKNSPRPTYHWRLPNCRIDEKNWTPRADWERWTRVEALAADAEKLATLSAAYLRDGPSTEFEARMRRALDYLT